MCDEKSRIGNYGHEALPCDEMEAVKQRMLSQLEEMSQNGVGLFVDGKKVLPSEAVSMAVREDSPYMADYVLDASGAVEQVRFDRVTCW